MISRTSRISGWVLTGLVGLFLIAGSGIPKFIDWPGKADMMAHLGIPLDLLPVIGAIEIAVTLLYLFPRTAFIGGLLLTSYLGGAVWTHLRVGDAWFFPIIVGIAAWAGFALRQPLLLRLVLGGTTTSERQP